MNIEEDIKEEVVVVKKNENGSRWIKKFAPFREELKAEVVMKHAPEKKRKRRVRSDYEFSP